MTVVEIITQLVGHVDGVGATDASNADRRARHLEWLVEAVSDIRSRMHPTWKRTLSASLSVTAAAASIVVPTGFEEVGHEGGVYLTVDGDPMDWVSEHEIMEMRRAPDGATATPSVYSIFSQDATSGLPLLQFPPLSGTITVYLDYESGAPTLDETTNSAKLTVAIPAQYHQRVLVPFLRWKAYDSVGDAKAQEWERRAEKAFTRMQIQERRGKSTPRGTRSFFGRA